tara:strand:+ start:469 stop:630 length:162 start_codon:yes stop_codon:yes gene_type:complete
MDTSSMKIYILNAVALLISFTEVDLVLKALLTIVVIGYTSHKWYLMNKNRKKE